MNTVILTSVLSAGNHALFSGTRVLYGLAVTSPTPHAPRVFARTTQHGVPLAALLATSSISVLCFGSSFIGSGTLWGWLQNLVGVSNQVRPPPRVCALADRLMSVFFFLSTQQIAWLSIGLASWRFRRAWLAQGRPLKEMKFRANWTWPWGPPFVVCDMNLECAGSLLYESSIYRSSP
jgi:AAT family amino acid transporter